MPVPLSPQEAAGLAALVSGVSSRRRSPPRQRSVHAPRAPPPGPPRSAPSELDSRIRAISDYADSLGAARTPPHHSGVSPARVSPAAVLDPGGLTSPPVRRPAPQLSLSPISRTVTGGLSDIVGRVDAALAIARKGYPATAAPPGAGPRTPAGALTPPASRQRAASGGAPPPLPVPPPQGELQDPPDGGQPAASAGRAAAQPQGETSAVAGQMQGEERSASARRQPPDTVRQLSEARAQCQDMEDQVAELQLRLEGAEADFRRLQASRQTQTEQAIAAAEEAARKHIADMEAAKAERAAALQRAAAELQSERAEREKERQEAAAELQGERAERQRIASELESERCERQRAADEREAERERDRQRVAAELKAERDAREQERRTLAQERETERERERRDRATELAEVQGKCRQLEQSLELVQKDRDRILQEGKDQYAQLQERYSAQCAELRLRCDAEVKRANDAVDERVAREAQETERQKERALEAEKSLRSALEERRSAIAAADKATREAETRVRETEKELRQEHTREMESLRADHVQQIAKCDKEHNEAMQSMAEQHKEAIAQVRAHAKAQLDSQKELYTNLQLSHSTELSSARDEYRSREADLKKEHENRIRIMEQDLQSLKAEMTLQKESYEKLQTAKRALEEELRRERHSRADDASKAHESEKALRAEHETAMAALRKEHEDQLARAAVRAEKKEKEVRAEDLRRILALEKQIEAVEAAREQERADWGKRQQENADKFTAVTTQHAAELKECRRMSERTQDELRAQLGELQSQLSNVTAENDRKLRDTAATLNKARTDAEKEVRDLRELLSRQKQAAEHEQQLLKEQLRAKDSDAQQRELAAKAEELKAAARSKLEEEERKHKQAKQLADMEVRCQQRALEEASALGEKHRTQIEAAHRQHAADVRRIEQLADEVSNAKIERGKALERLREEHATELREREQANTAQRAAAERRTREELDSMQADLEKLRDQLAARSADVEQAAEEARTGRERLGELQAECEAHATKERDLQQQLQDSESRRVLLEARLQELGCEWAEALRDNRQEVVDDLEQRWGRERLELEGRWSRERQELRAEVTAARAQAAEYKEQLGVQRRTAQYSAEEAERLRCQLRDMDPAAAAAASAASAATSITRQRESEAEIAASRAAAAEARLWESEANAALSRAAAAEAQQQAAAELAEARNALVDALRERDERKQALAEASAALSSTRGELDFYKQTHESESAAVEAKAWESIAAAQRELEQERIAADALREEVARLDAECSDANVTLNAQIQLLERADAELARYRSEASAAVGEAERERAAAQAARKELAEQREQAEGRVQSMQAALDRVRDELVTLRAAAEELRHARSGSDLGRPPSRAGAPRAVLTASSSELLCPAPQRGTAEGDQGRGAPLDAAELEKSRREAEDRVKKLEVDKDRLLALSRSQQQQMSKLMKQLGKAGAAASPPPQEPQSQEPPSAPAGAEQPDSPAGRLWQRVRDLRQQLEKAEGKDWKKLPQKECMLSALRKRLDALQDDVGQITAATQGGSGALDPDRVVKVQAQIEQWTQHFSRYKARVETPFGQLGMLGIRLKKPAGRQPAGLADKACIVKSSEHAEAGLRPGDLIVSVLNPRGEFPIRSRSDLVYACGPRCDVFVGAELTLQVVRGHKEIHRVLTAIEEYRKAVGGSECGSPRMVSPKTPRGASFSRHPSQSPSTPQGRGRPAFGASTLRRSSPGASPPRAAERPRAAGAAAPRGAQAPSASSSRRRPQLDVVTGGLSLSWSVSAPWGPAPPVVKELVPEKALLKVRVTIAPLSGDARRVRLQHIVAAAPRLRSDSVLAMQGEPAQWKEDVRAALDKVGHVSPQEGPDPVPSDCAARVIEELALKLQCEAPLSDEVRDYLDLFDGGDGIDFDGGNKYPPEGSQLALVVREALMPRVEHAFPTVSEM